MSETIIDIIDHRHDCIWYVYAERTGRNTIFAKVQRSPRPGHGKTAWLKHIEIPDNGTDPLASLLLMVAHRLHEVEGG